MRKIKVIFSFIVVIFFITLASSASVNAKMTKVVSVFAGFDYSGVIDDRGTVHIFGNGQSTFIEFSKRQFSRELPVKIVFSEQAIFVLTDEGSVYAWGEDPSDSGILATPENIVIEFPTKIDQAHFSGEKIIDLAASKHHVIAVSESGKAYGWGTNTKGELLNANVKERSPKLLSTGLFNLRRVKVSNTTTAFIETNGHLLMSGDNSFNQLGVSSDMLLLSTTLRKITVAMTNFQSATDVAVGDDFTIAINNNGRIIGFGNAENSRLGVVTEELKLSPTLVSDDMEYVFQVSSFQNGVVTIGSTGKAFTFGSNIYGILGQGQQVNTVESPTAVQLSTNYRIVQIATGTNHAIALTSSGDVLAWGNNDAMQLGTTGITNYFSKPVPVIIYEKSHIMTYLISIVILGIIVFNEVIFNIVYYEKEKKIFTGVHDIAQE